MKVLTGEEVEAMRARVEDDFDARERAEVQRALAAVAASKRLGLVGRQSARREEPAARLAVLEERLDGLAARVRELERQRHAEG